MNKADAARKVKSLRRVAASDSGATSHERATAAKLADGLEQQHGPLDCAAPSFTISVDLRGYPTFYRDFIRDAVRPDEDFDLYAEREAKRRHYQDILNGVNA